MKRVKPVRNSVWLPIASVRAGSVRGLFEQSRLQLEAGNLVSSGCLSCPDEPCIRFSGEEVARATRVLAPYAPDAAVCPTGAIRRDGGGFPSIDDNTCIGCGLCVIRCPVGAIHLKTNALAEVVSPDGQTYECQEVAPKEFNDLRNRISSTFSMESVPFLDAQHVDIQLARAEDALTGIDGQRILRLLTRNTFLLAGIAARLKNPGDNNASCELVVDDGELLLVSEIEPSSDVLDALRRSLAGCAIVISRYGIGKEDVCAAVFLHRLPNERVDFYRVVRDIRTRLGISTYTIPAAVLLLAIRAHGKGLAQFIREGCHVDDQSISLAPAASEHFGDLDEPALLGLAPSK